MLKGIKSFVRDAKEIIRKENIKINNFHREINEYEAIIEVVSLTGGFEIVENYREKIEQCYINIEKCVEVIQQNRDKIATMKMISDIIKRGEKCA